MSKFDNGPILDEATLLRMNEEFRAGAYDQLEISPVVRLDPKSDPFGMDYEWLEPSRDSTDFVELYAAVLSQPSSERRRIASAAVRRTALTGSLAGGTDDQVFQKWLGQGFVGLCHEVGPTGVELLANIRKDTEVLSERVRGILTLFRETLPKGSFTSEEEITIASAIIHALKLPQ